jgi:hypothetical protein
LDTNSDEVPKFDQIDCRDFPGLAKLLDEVRIRSGNKHGNRHRGNKVRDESQIFKRDDGEARFFGGGPLANAGGPGGSGPADSSEASSASATKQKL